ncbi:MAG: hypothetical protein ACRDTG_03545 [Pseudonocardiaceae bacterium]
MTDRSYRSRTGATFRGIINDLKRNTESAAAELGVEPELIDRIIAGEMDVPAELVRRAVSSWPVNERDFFPIHDDAPDGVIVMRADESAKTSRVFQRGGTDYYEYRDTAMSRVAMFRPEWIKMLQPVTDDDPNNPAVRWNNGHFLYQFTYFVGAVNYYYEWEGRRHCAVMNTGDSVSGLPYAPHSFTRRGAEPGLILALTYGGRLLGDAQHEIGALGPELAQQYAPAADDELSAFAHLLTEQLADTLLTPAQLAGTSGMAPQRVAELLAGRATPSAAEVDTLAEALRVNSRDLLPMIGTERDGVQIMRGAAAQTWFVPDVDAPAYRVKALAGTRLCPSSRALEIEVLGSDPAAAHQRTGLHQYCYVLGPDPVDLAWEHRGERFGARLEPGDSLYLKPFVPHGFTRCGDGSAAVLALRIGGKVSGDARREAAALGRATVRRLVSDNGQWYDPSRTSPTNGQRRGKR